MTWEGKMKIKLIFILSFLAVPYFSIAGTISSGGGDNIHPFNHD